MNEPDPLLTAAREVFEQFGARRARFEDVARRAGVSRSTLYRRFATKDALLDAVLIAELDRFLVELDRAARGLSPQDAVVECFARGIALTREIPLLRMLTEHEPETIVAMGSGTHADLLALVTKQVVETLRTAGATMPEAELTEAGELMLRLAYSFLLNPGTLGSAGPDEVRSYARRWLAPLIS